MQDSFQIAGRAVHPSLNRIDGPNGAVEVEPKTMAVLVCLAQQRGEVVSADELIEQIWAGRPMSDNPVYKCIAKLRKVLGDDAHNAQIIETIPKHGYRLLPIIERPGDLIADSNATPNADTAAARSTHRQASRAIGRRGFEMGAALVFVGLAILGWKHFGSGADRQTTKDTRAPPSAPGNELLVVFPVDNLSSDPLNSLICVGISDELRHALDQVAGLDVVDRYSTMAFKEAGRPSSEIANVLGASYSVAGSLRNEGNRRRIIMRLVDNKKGINAWSRAFEFRSQNELEIQATIAQQVTGAVTAKVTSPANALVASPEPPASAYTDKLQAHLAYLRGRQFQAAASKASLHRAIEQYQKAIQIDPDFARAWHGLARSRMAQIRKSYANKTETYPLAVLSGERAIELDPTNGDAWATACLLRMTEALDWRAAAPVCQTAIELAANTPEGWNIAATKALIFGQLDAAIEATRRRAALDPLRASTQSFLGGMLMYRGHYDQARDVIRVALEINQNVGMAHGVLGHIFLAENRTADAIAEFKRELVPVFARQGLAMAYYAGGHFEQSEQTIHALIAEKAESDAFQIAEYFAFASKPSLAFEWLERAEAQCDSGLALLQVSPYLGILRDDPRWAPLVDRLTGRDPNGLRCLNKLH